MRPLALALAAAVLGTGCIVTDDDDDHYVPAARGDAIVYWEFIRNAPAQPDGFVVYDASLVGTGTGPCPESAVEVVSVSSAAGTIDVNCQEWNAAEGMSIQGIVVGNLPAGAQNVRVRGYRGSPPNQVLVYDWTVTVDVIANASVEAYVSVEPVRAPVELFAYLTYGLTPADFTSCAAAGTPNIAFTLSDGAGTLVDEGEVGCSDPLPAFVYADDLDLDNYLVRMQGVPIAGPSAGLVAFDSCGYPFDHFAAQTGAAGVAPDLWSQPLPVCPGE